MADTNRGLYQPAGEPAPGLLRAGVNDYGVLRSLDAPVYYDSPSRGSWSSDGETLCGFDDPNAVAGKTEYVTAMGLGGVMVWELAGDTRDGELMQAVAEALPRIMLIHGPPQGNRVG